MTTPEFGEVNDSRPHIPGLALSCKHKVACLFGYCRYGGVDHCSRNAWQHRGVNDTQTRNAFNAQSFINDGPDAAGADRMVEGIRRATNEIVLSGNVCPAGARVDFLRSPFGKGGAGADVAGECNAVREDGEISSFREVVGIDAGLEHAGCRRQVSRCPGCGAASGKARGRTPVRQAGLQ